MQIQKFLNEEAWLEARLGKVTGTRLKDLISKTGKRKKGFYEIIAERIALPANKENVMDRGHRLEDEAVQRFVKETSKQVSNDLEIWYREDNQDIAFSPDGSIGKTEAVEVKCLNSAAHIEAYLTQEIPDEYEYQVIQAFVVNEELEKLYFIFYDPRMPKDFFYIEIARTSIQDKVNECLELEIMVLNEINKLEDELTF